jgi:hypothetical protein
MTRPRHTTAALLLLAVADCGANPSPPASPSPSASTPAQTSAAPTTPAAPSPSPDLDAPRPFGTRLTSPTRYVDATVFGYKQPVAKTAPRPDEQPGFVWGAAEVVAR